jgi:hypothetical protein
VSPTQARFDLNEILDSFGLEMTTLEDPPLTDDELCDRLASVDATTDEVERARILLRVSRES